MNFDFLMGASTGMVFITCVILISYVLTRFRKSRPSPQSASDSSRGSGFTRFGFERYFLRTDRVNGIRSGGEGPPRGIPDPRPRPLVNSALREVLGSRSVLEECDETLRELKETLDNTDWEQRAQDNAINEAISSVPDGADLLANMDWDDD